MARGRAADNVNDRERRFAQAIVGGLAPKVAMSKAGYSPKANPGSVLARHPVIRYIEELRDRQAKRLDYTVENLCARLEHIAWAALDEGQFAPAVSAVMGIAKMMGHLNEKSEIELHVISKPAREPTKEVDLTPEEWQRQFAPKLVQ
jgi:hypothetical protein